MKARADSWRVASARFESGWSSPSGNVYIVRELPIVYTSGEPYLERRYGVVRTKNKTSRKVMHALGKATNSLRGSRSWICSCNRSSKNERSRDNEC